MVRVIFVQSTGETRELDGEAGRTALEVGLAADIPELASECGGMCTCSECHVVIDKDWFARLPEPAKNERAILSMVEGAVPESRLSCQITLSGDLDGLTLHTLAPAPGD
ncbi:MAG: 2Fe-2S ferredoxin [Sphingomonadaceae bacterium]